MMQLNSKTTSARPSSTLTTPVTAPLRSRFLRLLVAAGVASSIAVPAAAMATVTAHAATFDNGAAESRLIDEINQDRVAAGLGTLAVNATLSSIARGAPQNVCNTPGTTLHGRSQDMIERGYFAHQIPPCSSYVWPILTSYGVQYSSAGENIGWNTFSPQSVSVDQVNAAFMGSPEHKANILGAYNQVGVGAYMAPGTWNGSTGVIMYTEIFVQGPIPPPPPPVISTTSAMAATGTDSAAWQRDGSSAFSSLGGVLSAAPAVFRATPSGGVSTIFYIGTGADHDLWVRSAAAGWTRLDPGARVYCNDNPAAAMVGSTLYVACQGGDRGLWVGSTTLSAGSLPAINNWQPLGGSLMSGPAAEQLPGDSEPTFMADGLDGAVWARRLSSGWTSTNWHCVGHPALAGGAATAAYFACHGSDGQLWYATNSGSGWVGTAPLGGSLVDGVGATATSSGVSFYGAGRDGRVWSTSIVNGAQSPWGVVGGNVLFGVGAEH